jgi:hypothetical protein
MKIAIMHPYFFPYLGYFSLIKNTDKFILLDSVQFIRHGWIERNRILKSDEGWLYIGVPLKKHKHDTLIKEIEINNEINWEGKIIAQLGYYKKIAPFYYKVIKLLETTFSNKYEKIVDLNKATLKMVCDYLGISNSIEVYSEMGLCIEPVTAPDEWALNICKAINGVEEYWNPEGGASIFDKRKFRLNNMTIKFLHQNLEVYNQKRGVFESGLSIIDIIMFNSPEVINEMLTKFELL